MVVETQGLARETTSPRSFLRLHTTTIPNLRLQKAKPFLGLLNKPCQTPRSTNSFPPNLHLKTNLAQRIPFEAMRLFLLLSFLLFTILSLSQATPASAAAVRNPRAPKTSQPNGEAVRALKQARTSTKLLEIKRREGQPERRQASPAAAPARRRYD
ncbi:hypothetical protein BDY24DRAFT_237908 [Mrakia frigida]|uniref:uncharacterized protein n=1 Tax=Mrakia frigida TaxID=29902 RepID=UPI003FCC0DCB